MAAEIVKREGLIIKTGNSMSRLNPAAGHCNEMARQVRGYAAEFGLTPASRARAGAPVQSEADSQIDVFLDNPETAHVDSQEERAPD